MDELIKKADIGAIASKGAAIYDKIKTQYEPRDLGKFLAIDVDTEKVYLGNSSAEAVEKARQENPDKVFYIVKIGFGVAETISQILFNFEKK